MAVIFSEERKRRGTSESGFAAGSDCKRSRYVRTELGVFFNVAPELREGKSESADPVGFGNPGGFLVKVLNNVSAAVFIVDSEGNVRAENAAFRKLFETNPGGHSQSLGVVIGCARQGQMVTGCGATDACRSCELRGAVFEAIRKNRRTDHGYLVHRLQSDSMASERHFQFCVDPVNFDGSRYAAVVMEDVTTLYETNERLARLNGLKNEFLGMVAHDLRTPTSLIRGFSSILREKAADLLPADDLQMLDVIFTQSDFALFLLDDLLDISELESGKVRLDLETTDFLELIQETIRLNRPFIARKHMSVFLTCNESIDPLVMDRRKVAQVLNNLFSNAIKYSTDNTDIHVTVDRGRAGAVVTRVKNYGQGIHPDEIGGIFDGFAKGRTRPTGGEKSTGLGLMIAKRIIDAHGGSIGVRSEFGKWAEFEFSLPAEPPKDSGDQP